MIEFVKFEVEIESKLWEKICAELRGPTNAQILERVVLLGADRKSVFTNHKGVRAKVLPPTLPDEARRDLKKARCIGCGRIKDQLWSEGHLIGCPYDSERP